jgi:hypothetical protein
MPCTICKTTGCRADVCLSPIIEESYRILVNNIERDVTSTSSFADWPAYRVSNVTNYWRYSEVFDGEPDVVREKISGARTRYLHGYVAVEIKKKVRRITSSWGIGLFKRVVPRLLSNFPQAYIHHLQEYTRLLVQPNLVTPRTCSDYKSYISGLAIYCMLKMVPAGFLDLSGVPDDQLKPPGQPTQVRHQVRPRTVYRDRVVYKEIYVKSKITMNMCGSDEKYMIDDTCPICMDDTKPNNVVAFTCGHAFCCDCSVECLKRGDRKCPMCRTKTTDVKFKADILPEKFNAIVAVVK